MMLKVQGCSLRLVVQMDNKSFPSASTVKYDSDELVSELFQTVPLTKEFSIKSRNLYPKGIVKNSKISTFDVIIPFWSKIIWTIILQYARDQVQFLLPPFDLIHLYVPSLSVKNGLDPLRGLTLAFFKYGDYNDQKFESSTLGVVKPLYEGGLIQETKLSHRSMVTSFSTDETRVALSFDGSKDTLIFGSTHRILGNQVVKGELEVKKKIDRGSGFLIPGESNLMLFCKDTDAIETDESTTLTCTFSSRPKMFTCFIFAIFLSITFLISGLLTDFGVIDFSYRDFCFLSSFFLSVSFTLATISLRWYYGTEYGPNISIAKILEGGGTNAIAYNSRVIIPKGSLIEVLEGDSFVAKSGVINPQPRLYKLRKGDLKKCCGCPTSDLVLSNKLIRGDRVYDRLSLMSHVLFKVHFATNVNHAMLSCFYPEKTKEDQISAFVEYIPLTPLMQETSIRKFFFEKDCDSMIDFNITFSFDSKMHLEQEKKMLVQKATDNLFIVYEPVKAIETIRKDLIKVSLVYVPSLERFNEDQDWLNTVSLDWDVEKVINELQS